MKYLIFLLTIFGLSTSAKAEEFEICFICSPGGSPYFTSPQNQSIGRGWYAQGGQFVNIPDVTGGLTMYGIRRQSGFGTALIFHTRGRKKVSNPELLVKNGGPYHLSVAVKLSESYHYNQGTRGRYVVDLSPYQSKWVSSTATGIERIDVIPWRGFDIHLVGVLRWEETEETPEVIFDLTDDTPEAGRRVLTHKYGDGSAENGWKHFGADDRYPSLYQTEDGEIEIVATVTDENGKALSGRKVHFRVIDPEDPVDWVAMEKKHTGDNRDPADAAWKEMKTPKSQQGNGPAGTVSPESAVSDSSGVVLTTLRITDRYAGDNYRVIASTDPDFPCANDGSCAQSGELVAWKRVYVETNRMYQQGGLIVADAPAGSVKLEIATHKGLPKAPFEIILLHAWRLADKKIGFDQETATVVDVEKTTKETPAILKLANPLSRGFYTGEWAESQQQIFNETADGFAPASSNLYDADTDLSDALFKPACVEYVWLKGEIRGAEGRLPRVDPGNPQAVHLLDLKWGRTNYDPISLDSLGLTIASGRPNHQILYMAGDYSRLGHTWVAWGINGSWIFRERLDSQPDGSLFGDDEKDEIRAAEAVAHELAHQWAVNPDAEPVWGEGHCGRYDKNAPASSDARKMVESNGLCTMTTEIYGSAEVVDGVLGFHYQFDGVVEDSELIEIREKTEPVPQHYPDRKRIFPW